MNKIRFPKRPTKFATTQFNLTRFSNQHAFDFEENPSLLSGVGSELLATTSPR